MSSIEKYRAQEKAFINGMERAKNAGLVQHYDVMICILTELREAGLMIVWQPGEKPKPGEVK